jgi:hypothetical protein
MATYYVRKMGNDSNAGTSPETAWATLGKAVGASGAVFADTVHVGPGTYRETVTTNAAAAGAILQGDPLGQYTGDDPGIVRWSAFTSGPYADGSNTCWSNSQTGMTVRNFAFLGESGIVGICNNLTVDRCLFQGVPVASSAGMRIVATYGSALGLSVTDSFFTGFYRVIHVQVPRGGASDYDLNSSVRRSISVSNGSAMLLVEATGSGAAFGNGVDMDQCTILGQDVGSIQTLINTSTT